MVESCELSVSNNSHRVLCRSADSQMWPAGRDGSRSDWTSLAATGMALSPVLVCLLAIALVVLGASLKRARKEAEALRCKGSLLGKASR